MLHLLTFSIHQPGEKQPPELPARAQLHQEELPQADQLSLLLGAPLGTHGAGIHVRR